MYIVQHALHRFASVIIINNVQKLSFYNYCVLAIK